MPAIFRDAGKVHLEDDLLDVAAQVLVALEDLGDELSLPVMGHLQAIRLVRSGHEVPGVVAVAPAFTGGGNLR